MFEIDRFIEECRAALAERAPNLAVQEIVSRAASEPGSMVAALGEPEKAGTTVLHRADDLTVLQVVWAPLMQIYPHDHRTWAVIGIYGGQEDNAFYRRRKGAPGLEQVNARSIAEAETISLGPDAIHAVTNPRRKFTSAIHVYGGDFFTIPRSEWDTPEASEQPYSVERAMQAFADANERAKELLASGD